MRIREILLWAGSLASLLGADDLAFGQTALPEVVVKQPKAAPKPAASVKRVAADKPAPRQLVRQVAQTAAAPSSPSASPSLSPEATAARALAGKTDKLDQARDNILPRAGANSTDLGQDGIAAAPQGDNAPIDKVLLQAPGISQDFSG